MKNDICIDFDILIINSEGEWEVHKTVSTQDEAKHILFNLEEKSQIIMRETTIIEQRFLQNF